VAPHRSDAAVAQPVPAASPVAQSAAVTATTVHAARSGESHAAPDDRFHTVRPGESLWSIAADMLGENATVAAIAREVNRLWELNQERIGTGQPDLLHTGTRLMLR
jgi:nucleoid-associated protein YgaU